MKDIFQVNDMFLESDHTSDVVIYNKIVHISKGITIKFTVDNKFLDKFKLSSHHECEVMGEMCLCEVKSIEKMKFESEITLLVIKKL